ncbi:hypothetical protein [Neisseria musculi]|uniref:hypothetical protein n=1 Tax=Neisseria musculi TaxID=1815583 RepID=UPI0036218F17
MKKSLIALALSATVASKPYVQVPARFMVADKLSVIVPRGRIDKSGVAVARRAKKHRKAKK